MTNDKQRERLAELIGEELLNYSSWSTEMALAGNYDMPSAEEVIADKLLADGWMRPPCKVGDKVYYVSESPLNLSVQANTIYEADVSRIITTRYGTTLVIQIHNSYGCTEIPDVNDFGKTVFLTKEEAEQALNNIQNGNSCEGGAE